MKIRDGPAAVFRRRILLEFVSIAPFFRKRHCRVVGIKPHLDEKVVSDWLAVSQKTYQTQDDVVPSWIEAIVAAGF